MSLWRIPLTLALAAFGITGAAHFGESGIEALGAGISVMSGQSHSDFAGWLLAVMGLALLAPSILCCLAIIALWTNRWHRK